MDDKHGFTSRKSQALKELSYMIQRFLGIKRLLTDNLTGKKWDFILVNGDILKRQQFAFNKSRVRTPL